ncbi:phosphatase PAP2 family protein [Fructobacillus sp. M1-13]|uniref:Phosphatase PAP2 family protein n=1 Tax=Fructobacillus papyriferae TaxID=2713171 RepID=A0ABS5QN63_9LACO|nr:phosphatase PAP2 family protein [Fructobacillus papyriferae]MBS9334528.1 phosphatase PAP2 family protein [Fructobacillus papyriferae]MCD2158517.1 phosphatase PAP2 family protein [Fructobacillus papyriferae]
MKTRIQQQDSQSRNFEATHGEKIGFAVFYLLAFLVLLLASFYDRSVSQGVMDRSSAVGQFFQEYGIRGPNIILFSSFQLIAWATFFSNGSRVQRLLITAVFLILSMNQILFSLKGYFAYTLAQLINGDIIGVEDPKLIQWCSAFVMTVLLSFLFFFYLKKRSEEERRYLLKAAVFGIVLVFLVSLTIGDLKLHWGRYRPFQMDQQMSQFTPWWQPNGSNGHFSFPSGHTTSGWLLVYLIFFLPRSWRKAQSLLLIVTVTLAITIALSRVRYGAHWLSDVTAASLIVFSYVMLISRLLRAHFVESET